MAWDTGPDLKLDIERVEITRVDHGFFAAHATVFVSQGYVLRGYVVVTDELPGTAAHGRLRKPQVRMLLRKTENRASMARLSRDDFGYDLERAILSAYAEADGEPVAAPVHTPTNPPSSEVLITPIRSGGPFKASALVLRWGCSVTDGFRIRDAGDAPPSVCWTRPLSGGEREVVVEPDERIREMARQILAAYRGYGGEECDTADLPRPSQPPPRSRRAAQPLPDEPTI